MAEVFAASAVGAEGFSRKVAIKRVLPGYSDDAGFAKMFIVEAQISSHLVHPNVVSVLDFARTQLPCGVGDSARPTVNAPRASCTMSGGPRSGGELTGAEHVCAVEILDPVRVVDGVEVTLAEVRGDGHRGEMV